MTSTTPATGHIELSQRVDLGAVTVTVRIAASRSVLSEDAAIAVRLGLEQLADALEQTGPPVDTEVFDTQAIQTVGAWALERVAHLVPVGAAVSAEVVHQDQPRLTHHALPRP